MVKIIMAPGTIYIPDQNAKEMYEKWNAKTSTISFTITNRHVFDPAKNTTTTVSIKRNLISSIEFTY